MIRFMTLATSLMILTAAGCAKSGETTGATAHRSSDMAMAAHGMEITDAVAVLHPLGSAKTSGVVWFRQRGDSLKVIADVSGLTPGQKHGFHVHEYGDCTAPDGTSAGSHYDPSHTGHHAAPTSRPRHAGDMGNLQADASGKAHLELELKNASITGENPILGRAVIVHAKPDQFTQPTGDAGGRIACGVIGVAKSK